ncbi:hypothetical protein [Frankia nepalensis]|uniref:Uncharacterized protein n=1 Tax=Frankia nepalensis TaxID=1836974 RepID=A0A937RG63_9ACTN|nr:hypothetical protein [Frankia nepalensis]MBL7502462.1 hypothetical protein [Frankia nepalensis]MBL7516355.1 hypothetical protein [Frankia nepalensis]MBL7625778.1 hypothetical protein [Frankia nepalensis]
MTGLRHRVDRSVPLARANARGLLLMIAVLFGILAMHGGFGTYLGPDHEAMTASAGGGAATSMDIGVDHTEPLPKPHEPEPAAIHADQGGRPTSPPDLLDALMSSWGRHGHVGEVCLAVLRSVALLAGLLLILLLVGARHGVSRSAPLAAGRRRPRHQPYARGPSLSFLCVLRL